MSLLPLTVDNIARAISSYYSLGQPNEQMLEYAAYLHWVLSDPNTEDTLGTLTKLTHDHLPLSVASTAISIKRRDRAEYLDLNDQVIYVDYLKPDDLYSIGLFSDAQRASEAYGRRYISQLIKPLGIPEMAVVEAALQDLHLPHSQHIVYRAVVSAIHEENRRRGVLVPDIRRGMAYFIPRGQRDPDNPWDLTESAERANWIIDNLSPIDLELFAWELWRVLHPTNAHANRHEILHALRVFQKEQEEQG